MSSMSDIMDDVIFELAIKRSSDGFLLDRFEGVQGIYMIRGEDDSVLYIGESSNIAKRLKSHIRKPKFEDKIGYFNVIPMVNSLIDEKEERLKLESILIDIFNPKYNVNNKGASIFLEDIVVERIRREDKSTWLRSD